MEKLKPCPFCGAPAEIQTGMGEFWVLCERNCQSMKHKKSLAIKAWNQRTENLISHPDGEVTE